MTVQPGVLAEAGAYVARLTGAKKAAVVTDSTVGPLHVGKLVESLKGAGIEAIVAVIPAGEEHKKLETLLPVYDTLLGARVERGTPVVALGGGVIGDMAGLVAATLLRGVPFVQVPTTLLAMVDASVGGKVGVDTAHGKNLIGAFHQPVAVLADPLVLATLPPREIKGGLAECVKHDIIRDAEGFADLESNVLKALAGDVGYLTKLVAHNVGIKASVVAADPYERGERAHLNLGHTFGHAMESVSNYRISHGEAVALGTAAASFAAVKVGLLSEAERGRIVALLEKVGLPVRGMGLDVDAVVNAMVFDKKVKAGKVRFVLPRGIGAAVVRDDVPVEVVREAVESVR